MPRDRRCRGVGWPLGGVGRVPRRCQRHRWGTRHTKRTGLWSPLCGRNRPGSRPDAPDRAAGRARSWHRSSSVASMEDRRRARALRRGLSALPGDGRNARTARSDGCGDRLRLRCEMCCAISTLAPGMRSSTPSTGSGRRRSGGDAVPLVLEALRVRPPPGLDGAPSPPPHGAGLRADLAEPQCVGARRRPEVRLKQASRERAG